MVIVTAHLSLFHFLAMLFIPSSVHYNLAKNYGVIYLGFGIGSIFGSIIASLFGGFYVTFCVIFALLILSLALSTTIRQPQREVLQQAHA